MRGGKSRSYRYAPSRVAMSKAVSLRDPAFALERALATLLAPGMGSMTLDEAMSQASATS
uniref:Uncharacterized protein n=1 Tax=uncultured bacterium HF186_25m_30B18 TaxID=662885 RepID=C7FPB8_9BACT|nr:hypothetical protein [uncultured bacterium HF186_25m_30B18]